MWYTIRDTKGCENNFFFFQITCYNNKYELNYDAFVKIKDDEIWHAMNLSKLNRNTQIIFMSKNTHSNVRQQRDTSFFFDIVLWLDPPCSIQNRVFLKTTTTTIIITIIIIITVTITVTILVIMFFFKIMSK